MFREMRRGKQALEAAEAEAILRRATSGVLAVSGEAGYPYAVPLSFAYADGMLYFHSATAGHKIDALRRCEKASFCVIERDQVVAEELTTYFRSVIAFGRVRIIEETADKLPPLYALAAKYAPSLPEERVRRSIDREIDHLVILEMRIEHLSGKEAIELVRARRD